jgi:hypothetical protein
MQKVTLILFTYKRAIMLDYVLSSIFKNFKNAPEKIHIIYHYNKKHQLSYNILRNKWKKFNIKFYRRKKISIFNFLLLFFLRPSNFIWILRWPTMIKNFNNFKVILEKIIRQSKNNFITLVTDDQIFFEKTIIPNFIFKRLTIEKNTFYRFFTGIHFQDDHKISSNLKIERFNNVKPKVFKWNLVNKFAFASWKYRFTIDGTLYNKLDFLKLIEPMIYHNPITLEAIGLWESKFRGFFKHGYSSQKRTAAHYQINNVQKLVINQCSNFDPDILMKAYELGYRIKINSKEFNKNKFNILPTNLNLYKKNKVINYKKFLNLYLENTYE